MKKMKKLFTIALLFAAIFCSANTNTSKESSEELNLVSITGTVIDAETRESLAGVLINISDYRIYTDLEGNFSLDIPHYMLDNSINVTYISYEEVTLNPANDNISLIEISPVR